MRTKVDLALVDNVDVVSLLALRLAAKLDSLGGRCETALSEDDVLGSLGDCECPYVVQKPVEEAVAIFDGCDRADRTRELDVRHCPGEERQGSALCDS
jgi:hypothetical protein